MPYTDAERQALLNLADGLEVVAMSIRARRGADDRDFAIHELQIAERACAAVAGTLIWGGSDEVAARSVVVLDELSSPPAGISPHQLVSSWWRLRRRKGGVGS